MLSTNPRTGDPSFLSDVVQKSYDCGMLQEGIITRAAAHKKGVSLLNRLAKTTCTAFLISGYIRQHPTSWSTLPA
jgi:hypothetical protein